MMMVTKITSHLLETRWIVCSPWLDIDDVGCLSCVWISRFSLTSAYQSVDKRR